MRKILELPDGSRIDPGKKATFELSLGYTYERITARVTGTGVAVGDINRVNLMMDGKRVMTWKTLQRLFDMNAYYGRSTDTIGEFCFHFFSKELHDLAYRRSPGIGTEGLTTFTLEFNIDGAAPADINIELDGRVTDNQPLGTFFKVLEFPADASVAGELDVTKLPKGAFYKALWFAKSDISHVNIKVDDVEVIDADKDVLTRDQKEASPIARAPVTASYTVVDFCTDGDLAQALNTDGIKKWQIRPTLDTSGAMDIIAETLDVLEA